MLGVAVETHVRKTRRELLSRAISSKKNSNQRKYAQILRLLLFTLTYMRDRLPSFGLLASRKRSDHASFIPLQNRSSGVVLHDGSSSAHCF
jgi:hypothetical protein